MLNPHEHDFRPAEWNEYELHGFDCDCDVHAGRTEPWPLQLEAEIDEEYLFFHPRAHETVGV